MAELVTIDGYDASIDYTIPVVNIWKNWTRRDMGIAGSVPHGTKVELIDRKGKRVKIRYGNAVGYVTDYFIKEFK